MTSFDVFYSFFIIKTSQEWGRTWYNPWKSKIEAKLHEESKFGRASKPFPNQSSVQGRESDEESNTEEFRNPLRNFRKPEGISQSLAKLKNFTTTYENFVATFFTCENFASPFHHMRNFRISFFTRKIFASPLHHCENFSTPFPIAKFSQLHISTTKSSCNLQIFCIDSIRFLP